MKKNFLFVVFFLTLFTSNLLAEFEFVQTKNVALDTPGIRGINFKPDGTVMYITNRYDDQKAYMIEYSLSTPFDISTATISFTGSKPKGTALACDGAGGDDHMELPHAIEFKPDGTRMFVTTNKDFSGSPGVAVFQFKLTTPWDSTTLVCEKIYEVDVTGSGNEDQVRTLAFKPDGTRMFVGGKDEDKIRVHGILTEGGTATNSIPSIVKLEWRIRGRTIDIVNEVNEKIDRSLKAGAMAMGANVRIRSIAGNLPMLQNKDINDIYAKNAYQVVGEGNVKVHPDDQSGGSTDMGDLSQIMPIIHPRSGGAIGVGHGNDYYIDDYYKSVINPAKSMAMTVIDLLWPEENRLKEIMNTHIPNYTKDQYINLQEKRMGNEFHEFMKS